METYSCIENRVDATRVNADDLVNELIAATDFDIDESAESKLNCEAHVLLSQTD